MVRMRIMEANPRRKSQEPNSKNQSRRHSIPKAFLEFSSWFLELGLRGILKGNNFPGQSHEPFAHLTILSAGQWTCQGKTGSIGKTDRGLTSPEPAAHSSLGLSAVPRWRQLEFRQS